MDPWIKNIIDKRIASSSAKLKADPVAQGVSGFAKELWNLPGDIKKKVGNAVSSVNPFATKFVSPVPNSVLAAKPAPTFTPTPTAMPTAGPTAMPTRMPTATPTVTPTRIATPTPQPKRGLFDFLRKPSPTPTASPTPSPTPTPKPDYVPYFDFEKYANVPEIYKPGLKQPSPAMGREIMTQFDQDKEATKGALVALSENMAKPYDQEGYNFNTPGDKRVTPGFEGTADYGPWQINSKTMNDFIKRHPKELKKIGISTVEDLKDPIKSTQLAKLIQGEQGWTNRGGGGWKGWVNKGITWK